MDELIHYERLARRLLTYTYESSLFLDEVNSKNVVLTIRSNPNPFSDLFMEVYSFIGSCFFKNYVTELKTGLFHGLLKIIDEPKADEFDKLVCSNFNVHDFIVPQAKGSLLSFYNRLFSNYSLITQDAPDEVIKSLDILLKPVRRDFSRFCSFGNNGFSLKYAGKFLSNRDSFILSLNGKPYNNLLSVLSEFDYVRFGGESNIAELFKAPSPVLSRVKQVIDGYVNDVRACFKSLVYWIESSKSDSNNKDAIINDINLAVECFDSMYTSYPQDDGKTDKLDEAIRNLWI